MLSPVLQENPTPSLNSVARRIQRSTSFLRENIPISLSRDCGLLQATPEDEHTKDATFGHLIVGSHFQEWKSVQRVIGALIGKVPLQIPFHRNPEKCSAEARTSMVLEA
jgi:hypothetical protein